MTDGRQKRKMARAWMAAFLVLLSVILVPAAAQDQGCQAQADLCFLLDDSGSIRDNNPSDGSYDNWDLLLEFVIRVVDRYTIGVNDVQVGVVKFSNNAELTIRLDRFRSKGALEREIRSQSYEGGLTNTYQGLKTLREVCFGPNSGERPDIRNVAIVITDGQPTLNTDLWQAEADRVKEDITVFAVGVTNMVDERTLARIASTLRNVDTVFSVNNFRSLETVLDILAEQTCTVHIDECNALVDIAFILDVSSSITWNNANNWDLMKNFVEYISRSFPVAPDKTRIGLVRFSDLANIVFDFNTYTNNRALSRAILNLQHIGGETNIADALQLTRTGLFTVGRGDRPNVKNVVILITDGTANVNVGAIPEETRLIKDAGNEVFVIGITGDIDERQLRLIASDPDDRHLFRAADFSRLPGILNDVTRRACEVVPTLPPPGVSTPAPTPPPITPSPVGPEDCAEQADICFLIDSSGSIRDNNPSDGSYDNWRLLLDFVKDIIGAFPIGLDATRVGAVQFSNQAELQFDLDDFTTTAALERAIDRISYMGGFTNTSGGLRVMRQQCFGRQNGDRSDVPNIAIIITDGVPTREEANTIPEVRRVKQEGIFVFAIGITNLINDSLLMEMSSPPQKKNEEWFSSPDFKQLDTVLHAVAKSACKAPTQPPACYARADIVFILDASGSITFQDSGNWKIMLDFIQFITNGFPVSPDATRIGLVRFSNSANVEFDLDDYRTGAEVRDRIAQTQHIGGETNITGALRVARTQIFTSSGGDRTGVKDVVILITDGQANVEKDGVVDEARRIKAQGVEVFSVGITDDVNVRELNDIATGQGGNHVFEVEQFDQLLEILVDVIDKTCEVVPTFIPNPTPITTPAPPPTTTRAPVPASTVSAIVSTTASVSTARTVSTVSTKSIVSTASTVSTVSTVSTMPTVTTETTESIVVTFPTPPNPGCDDVDVDVVFIMDTSGSIGANNFKQMQTFVINIISKLNIEGGNIRLGVVTFSDNPRLEFNMNRFQTRVDMENAVSKIVYTRGTTNTAGALRFAREQMFQSSAGDRANVKNMIMIITDGESNNGDETLEQAMITKKAGVHVISVGVGGWLDLHELRSMATYPTSENMIHVTDFNSFGPVVNKISSGICGSGAACNPNPCRNGRCIEVVGGYMCECRPGYAGKDCDLTCSAAADIVFVLDNSGSVRKDNFAKMVNFVTDAIANLDIDNGQQNNAGTRIGLLAYANDVQPQFNLNTHQTRLDILNSVNIRYTGGTTNTASALRYLRETMFRTGAGDRPNVPNLAVIFTDGKSDNPDDTWKMAQEARKNGITLIAVGIGEGVSQRELQSIASDPVSSNVISVNNFDGLTNIMRQLTEGICHNDQACRNNPCRNNAQCTNVIGGFFCGPCPQGYTGFLCERRCSGVADVAFVVDASGSIRRERFPEVLSFINSVINNLDVHPDRTRVGAIYWSDNAGMQFDLDDYSNRQDVRQAIERILFIGGRTHTTSALRMLRQSVFIPSAGDRETVPNFAIVITDGNSNINPEQTIPEAIQARIAGSHVIVVSVGKDLNMVELEGIASEPKENNIYPVDSIKTLPSILDQIITSFCDDVDECASNPCRSGGQCVNGLNRYICICPAGNTGYNCDRRCSRQMDVTMLLDLSGSVEEKYRMIMQFARRLTYGLDMQFDRTRIAAIAFSTNIIDRFYLNTYQNKEAVINALNFYHHGGRTNIPEALTTMRRDIFTPRNGDRSGVRNIGILVTDGYANINEFNMVPEAENARRQNIELFSVAVGENPNFADLNSVASDPDSEHVYQMQTLSDVDQTADSLLDYLCQ